ncbi:MAG: hypothetical protein KF847_20795 [Pirellulales bacterium]|nr:hypothetical protein [Pirellulales bacterium]
MTRYTARGELEELGYAGDVIDGRTYDDGGRLISETLGNGQTVTRTYATNENLVAAISNAAVGNYSYTWEARLRRRPIREEPGEAAVVEQPNKLTETISSALSGYGFTVPNGGYDDEDRPVAWNRDDTNLDQVWDLSPVGDWDEFTQNTVVQTRVHGLTHELLEIDSVPLAYDPRGHLTTSANGQTYTWDADGAILFPGADVLGGTGAVREPGSDLVPGRTERVSNTFHPPRPRPTWHVI